MVLLPPRDVRNLKGSGPVALHPPKCARSSKILPRALADLGIATLAEAFDGSGNFELLEVLATAEVPSEDAVVNATRRVAQLVTMIEAIEAAGQLGGRAVEAAGDDVATGKLTERASSSSGGS